MERVIQALVASLEPASLVSRVAEQACAFAPKADGAAITLLRATDNAYVTVSAHGVLATAVGFVVPKRGSLQGRAARERRPQLIADAMVDSRLTARVRSMNKQWGTRSWAAIPLTYNDHAIGSLLLAAAEPGAFTEEDLDSLLAISEFVSALIGAQSQISSLLTQVMTDSEERGQRALTARFVASVMLPETAEVGGLQDELESLLAQSNVLSVVFQPMVHLASGEALAYEGLTRFPPDSALTPQKWFTTARRLGRGVAIEHAALREVLTAATRIPDRYPVAVNLSPSAVLDPSIQELLVSVDRPLIVEVTEHEPFPESFGADLEKLRGAGVSVAVDDAGAGYASFVQLLRLRPDIIKIDGELVDGIDENPVKRAFATALKALGAELGAKIVAEAVETPAQLDTLTRLGIEYGQGFLLGRPVSEPFPT
ncbi:MULTISPECIES: EAL domain-containing protein [Mycobacteriaceae]|uniref:EAL domain-containing protein n=1 Tax=Mycolicibacterium parafortuitum TaxID=39692 RepID=A0ACC6MC34_MYCPF|nr:MULTISPECIES: EAL domain-containing protein [Mycobacteriaceae]MDZ5084506.1 EAL domain-containing protein [Mycolicibacterium parafortuitum]